ncbi:uncharacterized protein SCODWIG_03737 [Saccharomycodes ludwigii]|uniref:Uncharacterized protein n=1 Tax=Saccharomycodes ludwigii TaxID=36035 RepID=A0A376BBH6_9ASCO|nr:uncharacterized protein SCODWIG_03737 [Saccharomycodes ludwigii]
MNETNSFTQSSPSYRDKDFTSRGSQDSQQPQPIHTVIETSTAPETITIDSAHSAADTDIDLNDSINDSNNAELVVEEPIQPLNVFGHGQTQANDDSKISLDETNQAISKLPSTLAKKQQNVPDNFLEDLNLALSPTSPTASSALKNIGLHSRSESHVSQSSGGEKKGEKESNVDLSSGASDIDLNNTIDDSADLSFEKGDEVRYSQNFENISPTKFHEVSTIQEEDTKYGDNNKYSGPDKNLETSAPIIEEIGSIVPVLASGGPRKPVSRKKRSRGFSVTSTTPENEKKAELQHVANILEQINWDADDTVDSLLLKLNGKMTDIEYRFNKELSAVSDTTSKLSSTKIKNACDQIDPWLSFFSMELSSFSKDIEIVESADNGLQVESANKKKLWNDLSQILNDVSIDQKTLDELSRLPISERNLGQLEKSLLKLYTALNAICGNDFSQKGITDEDSYDLSKMRALRERRAVYESVTDAFVDRSVAELSKIFGSLGKSSLQISGILSRLLTYSSITLFVKYVSDDSFETIISEWNDNIAGTYEVIINQILNNVVNNTIAPLGKDSQAITSFKDVGYLLKAWDEYKKTRNVDYLKAFKEDTCLKDIFKAISQVETLCLSYQNFIGKFFHMSSENIKIDEYIVNNPPSDRPQPLDKLAEIESDRKVAGDKYQMVSCVFQNSLAKFFNGLSNAIRKKHQILAPSLMMYVENEITKNLQKSDQEFLLSHFNRFFEKLQHDWDDYVLEQQLSMDRANLNYNSKSISPSFVGFSLFVFDLQQQSKYFIKEFDSNVQAQVTFQKLDTTYHKLGACVVSLLTKEDLSERLVDSLAPSADLNNGSSDGHTASSNSSSISMKKINKTVSLLINSHWLVETQNLLENEATTEIIATSAKQVFDSEKEKYADILVKTSMPKLYSFVQNAWTIVNTAGNANKKVDPSKWSTYSQNNLNKILDGYTSQEIHSLIDKLHKNMLQHFENQAVSTSDNVGLYKSMQQDLFTQLWSCVQGVTVSFYLRLYSLIDKHYKGTHVKFSKNDIISGFNEHKK